MRGCPRFARPAQIAVSGEYRPRALFAPTPMRAGSGDAKTGSTGPACKAGPERIWCTGAGRRPTGQPTVSISPAILSFCLARDPAWRRAMSVGVPHPPLFFAPSPNAVPPDRSDVRPLPIDDRRSHECAVPCGPQALHFSSADLRITSFDILTFRATAEQVRPTTPPAARDAFNREDRRTDHRPARRRARPLRSLQASLGLRLRKAERLPLLRRPAWAASTASASCATVLPSGSSDVSPRWTPLPIAHSFTRHSPHQACQADPQADHLRRLASPCDQPGSSAPRRRLAGWRRASFSRVVNRADVRSEQS